MRIPSCPDLFGDRGIQLIYSVANQKGGVGKTTTAVNLGAAYAQLGKRVLVVDLDQQCNATVAFGLEKQDSPTTYEVLSGEVTLSEAAKPAGPENVWMVPASRDLAGAVVELPRLERPNHRLQEQVGSVDEDFDVVFIDCPPALGPITVNSLVASDRVIVPVQAEYLALEGLGLLTGTIARVRQALNQGLEIRGVVITMFDGRVALSGQVVAEVRKHFGPKVFDTVVPRSVRLAEAPSHGMPITAYAPTSPGGVAYKALAEELLRGDQPPAASEPLKAAVVLEPKAPALATTSVEDTQPVDASLSDPTDSADAAGPTDLGDAVPEGPVAS